MITIIPAQHHTSLRGYRVVGCLLDKREVIPLVSMKLLGAVAPGHLSGIVMDTTRWFRPVCIKCGKEHKVRVAFPGRVLILGATDATKYSPRLEQETIYSPSLCKGCEDKVRKAVKQLNSIKH
jgi:hypothetical protein